MLSSVGVWDLMNAGDWACAEGDGEALARVGSELAGRLREKELVGVARRVSELAEIDMDAATSAWGGLCEAVRSTADAAFRSHGAPA